VQSLPRRSVLSCWMRKQQRQWFVRCRQFLCDGRWGQRAVQHMPCWRVLLGGLRVVTRQRALSRRQLLDGGQRHQHDVHALPRGNVQHRRRVHVCCSLFGVPCRRVLSSWMQCVEGQRPVSCWQFLDCGQWHQCVVHRVPWRQVLPGGQHELQR